MVTFLKECLSPLGIKYQWQLRPKEIPSLTYSIIDSSPKEFSEGNEIAVEHTIQIDVWTKTEYTDLVERVKNQLSTNKFRRIYETDDFEEDVNIYHKVIRFSYLENK